MFVYEMEKNSKKWNTASDYERYSILLLINFGPLNKKSRLKW